jgi:hypothetical protein
VRGAWQFRAPGCSAVGARIHGSKNRRPPPPQAFASSGQVHEGGAWDGKNWGGSGEGTVTNTTGPDGNGDDRPVWERVREQVPGEADEQSPPARWMDLAQGVASRGREAAQSVGERRAGHKADQASAQVRGDRPLMVVTSHDSGKNAIVSLYADRIERVKERHPLAVSRASREVEVIPLSNVSHVGAKKAGIRTNLTVTVAGEEVTFRVSHQEAKTFRDAIVRQGTGTSQLTEHSTLAPTFPPPPPTPRRDDDPFEQIRKLGELRDQGLLTDAEFQEKKRQLLGL